MRVAGPRGPPSHALRLRAPAVRRDGSAGLLKLLKLRLIVAAARPPPQLKKRTAGGIETGGTDRGISEPGGCLETANTPPRLRGASAAPAVPELSGAERSRAPRAAAAAAPGLPPRMRGFGPLSYGNSSRPYGHDDSCAAVTAIKLQQGCGRRERLSQLLSTGWDRNAIDFRVSISRDFGVVGPSRATLCRELGRLEGHSAPSEYSEGAL